MARPSMPIEFVDRTNSIKLCLFMDCDEKLLCAEIELAEVSKEGIAAALARAFAEFSRPTYLAPLAEHVLDVVQSRKTNGD